MPAGTHANPLHHEGEIIRISGAKFGQLKVALKNTCVKKESEAILRLSRKTQAGRLGMSAILSN